MTTGAERVVVILDASKELSLSTIRWPLLGLSLKSGDKLIILGIIHQVNNPMGFRTKLDPSSMFGTNKKITGEETERKKEQYQKNAEIEKISKQCKNEQIEFRVEMLAGSSLKVVASRAVRRFHATWLVLDRHMKNDERYFVENLSCNMVRIKKDNKVKKLRGPAGRDDRKPPAARKSIVTYAEMIPATSPSKVQPPRKFQSVQNSISVKERGGEGSGEQPWHGNRKSTSHSASTSSRASNRASTSGYNESKYSSSHFHDEEHTTTIALETGGELSPISINESGDQKDFYGPDENQKLHNHNDDWMGGNPGDQELKNSVCLTCNNRRPKLGSMREFSYAELQAATEGFNAKNFLSEGGFGSVYRGEINGMKIAVKQHKYNASLQGEKEFKSEVQVLGTARNENLVMLVGYCSERNHRLLVYEFVCNGSLDLHLSKHTRQPLSWEKRVKIALGAAKGLKYLHEKNIIHRDMRPNNILVTHEFEPLLGDFGLARTQHEGSDQSSEAITRVVGTLGYLAPEYAECGKVSTKTDVYSFGVVLLQLITGMKTTDERLGGKSLVGWARPLLKDRNYPDLIDPRILESHDVHQLFWMVRVAEKCLSKDPRKRLTMDKVVYALNYIMDCDNSCCLRNFSPTQSDTVSRDSCESQAQPPIETTSVSSLSQFSERLPASLSISRKSSSSTLYDEPASSSGSGHERYL
ncbi:probable serine/threonine-protein kinase PBL5 isoform X2 [Durio zibethinus]|uniref:Probable serine/threonine-protein kinase PBL5 isoform X2 n=1 Tax=Durio zibethinus TaxID=66656 RepID=A0A6P5YV32_DURZI|nr:probable serine/threonine-protein kinase PBL5 isoform X2 [Durio zibethinus]